MSYKFFPNKTLKPFIKFVSEAVFSITTALILLIPWLLRVSSIFTWFASALAAIQTIQAIYSPFSPAIPTFALQFAAILLMVAWVMLVLLNGKQIWGALLAGGLVVWALAKGAAWLSTHWEHADLFFSVLPAILLATGMIHVTLRGRRIRQSKIGRPEQRRSGGNIQLEA